MSKVENLVKALKNNGFTKEADEFLSEFNYEENTANGKSLHKAIHAFVACDLIEEAIDFLRGFNLKELNADVCIVSAWFKRTKRNLKNIDHESLDIKLNRINRSILSIAEELLSRILLIQIFIHLNCLIKKRIIDPC